MKNMGIKLDDELHARLVILAQLRDTSLADLINQAIERFAEEAGSSPEFTAKAEELLAAIDRETAERKQAVQAILGGGKPKPNGGGRGRREG